LLEAEKQFRKVIGYTDLPCLAIAIERRLHLREPNPAGRDCRRYVTITPGPSSPKFQGDRGNLGAVGYLEAPIAERRAGGVWSPRVLRSRPMPSASSSIVIPGVR
jgi:hypothetical protein